VFFAFSAVGELRWQPVCVGGHRCGFGVSEHLPGTVVTDAASHRRSAVHVPSSRLMIGSDLPESLETEMSQIPTLETIREVKEDILWNTAVRLFAPAR